MYSNIIKHIIKITFALLLIGSCVIVNGQSKTKKIIIENADTQIFLLEEDPPTQKLIGEVRVFHEGAYFFCDSAIIKGNNMFAYGNVIIIQNDTISIFGDSLKYYGKDKKAFIDGKVTLQNGGEKLFTPSLEYHVGTKTAYYYNKAILENDGYVVKSKRGVYDTKSKIAYFYENVSVDGDDFRLVNDSLIYDMDKKISKWNTPTLIDQDSSKIYSESGYYDLDDKNALFTKNAQVVDGNSKSSGDSITYNDETKEIIIKGNAVYTTETDTASAKVITFNKDTEVSILTGNASYKSPENNATGEEIIYDKKNGSYLLKGKGMVSDPPNLIFGDNIDYNKKAKTGLIIGNVIWKDTSAQSDIFCDTLTYLGSEDYAKAIGAEKRPLLISYQDGDTMYLSADTLINTRQIIARDSITSDTIKYLIGDNNVKIFSIDYQAVGDSLSYNLTDSLFTLLDRPIIWQDTTQMTGDTIIMEMKNGALSHMHIPSKAMIITSPDLIFFNQIKGKKIDIDFVDKKIDKLKVNGNAQNIYYMLDDEDAYIGVNLTDCSLILYQFDDGKISTIRYYTKPESKILPMQTTDHEKIKLDGFNWQVDLRPVDGRSVR